MFAVGTFARHMAAGKKRHHTEASDAGLRVDGRPKRTVASLLGNEIPKRAIDGAVDLSALGSREHTESIVVGLCVRQIRFAGGLLGKGARHGWAKKRGGQHDRDDLANVVVRHHRDAPLASSDGDKGGSPVTDATRRMKELGHR